MSLVRYDDSNGGVYATRMIRKHERVCFYTGKDVYIGKTHKKSHQYMKHPLRKNIVRCGDKYQKCDLGVAQFMNDGFELHFGIHEATKYSPEIFRSCEKLVKKYVKLSKAKSNMSLEPNTFWFCSSRQIEEGEQLYYHYGVLYWLQKMYDTVVFNEWSVILHYLINRFGVNLSKIVITY